MSKFFLKINQLNLYRLNRREQVEFQREKRTVTAIMSQKLVQKMMNPLNRVKNQNQKRKKQLVQIKKMNQLVLTKVLHQRKFLVHLILVELLCF